jgi:hypothetical protein
VRVGQNVSFLVDDDAGANAVEPLAAPGGAEPVGPRTSPEWTSDRGY